MDFSVLQSQMHDMAKGMLDSTITRMENVERGRSKLEWKIKEFDEVGDIAEFLGDGKRALAASAFVWKSKLYLLYAVGG